MTKKQTGFTIIELMIVVSVVGIFAAVAIPAFQSTIQNNRMTTSTNSLIGVFYFARSESVKLSSDVRVCKSNDGASCNDSLDWNDGWLAWNDSDADGSIDAGEAILKVSEGFDDNMSVSASDDVKNSVNFSSRGMSSVSGSWTICDVRGADYAKALVINPSGRVKSSKLTHDGGTLVCP